MILTNESGIPLILAGWLVDDTYDYVDSPKFISATSLLKPTKATLLAKRVDTDSVIQDIKDYIPSTLGTAIHTGIENAWTQRYKENLAKLGYSQKVIDKIEVNPEVIDPSKNQIFFEQRSKKHFNGWVIGGKFDAVCDGILHDFKSTSVYTWIYGDKDEDYRLQGSVYKWLNPNIITEDYIRICFVFTDWQKQGIQQNPDYPPSRLMTRDIPLMTTAEIENYIKVKTSELSKYEHSPEEDMPECTDKELWRPDPVYKYYANPDNLTRATKKFDNLADANKHMAEKGKGIVIPVLGEPRRCQYCAAAPVCKQRRRYFPDD